MKKKILFVVNFTRLPWEHGNSRFPYIASHIDKEKFDVELITSTFLHGKKIHRKIEDIEKQDYKITLIDEPGYKKNVDIKRIWSHKTFAKNVEKYLNTLDNIDYIYLAIPSVSLAKVVTKFAKEKNIRLIVDIQDLWPEAFQMVFHIPFISSMIFRPIKKAADYVYRSADSLIAVSKTYLKRALTVNKTAENKLVVFLGTDLDEFDEAIASNKIEYNDDVFRIAYIGTLGSSYDIKCVIDSLAILKERNINNILFEVMGKGPLEDEFKNYAKEKNVSAEFTGYLNYKEMCAALKACDLAVNPIVQGAAQSIINKVGDYAAAGLPVVNTQECKEYRDIVLNYEIGLNAECGNAEDLADKIQMLYNDEALRKQASQNNRKLAEEKFDRKVTYRDILNIF